MRTLPRLLPRTIAAQMTCLVVAAVLSGVALTSVVQTYIVPNWESSREPEIVAGKRAARIAAIVEQTRTARTPQARQLVVAAARRAGNEVDTVHPANVVLVPAAAARIPTAARLVIDRLEDDWGIVPLGFLASADDRDSLLIRVDGDSALVFHGSPHLLARKLMVNTATLTIAIITFIILFLSIYAVRWITAPLSTIAAAARSFGRSSGEIATLHEDGPSEIAQVAEALNDMRRRIRTLVDERTRMLAAVSHDLRTPLARLGLRAERVGDENVRDGLLRDIAMVNDMLTETLTYLREASSGEPIHRIDLPSLLQTISAEFIDVGHPVSYEGPARLAFGCRSRALTRALTNVIDNATKHGSSVMVTLQELDTTAVQIDVSDDGVGIAHELLDKVFEPFFKVDNARPSCVRTGFGLGLSIARDIIKRDGGAIELLNRAPHGLTVRLRLASTVAAAGADGRA